MKVCFVVGTLARGGAEKQLVFMLRSLKELGIAADVLCLTKGESFEDEIVNAGFNVKWVGASKYRLSRLREISGALKESRASIIQSSHFYTNMYAAAAGKLSGIPSIGAIRSDLFYESESHSLVGNWQISMPSVLITNSQIAHRRLIERGIAKEKIEFVSNVVESPNGPTNGLPRRGLNILFAGRLDENKRPDRFVRLAASLTKQFPHLGLRFLIAGDGVLRSELERTANILNLTTDTLKFLGLRQRMGEIYRRADILVSTSEREGTPNVVLEAMAHGLPVVATNAGGTAEIIGEDRGIIVSQGDEGALAKATAELILDKELRLRLGDEGRRYVARNHSLENLKRRLNEVYQRLLQKI
jgi:glycosyltransferase involved in cell wall biosynthesis